jgi:hypothetical protein
VQPSRLWRLYGRGVVAEVNSGRSLALRGATGESCLRS